MCMKVKYLEVRARPLEVVDFALDFHQLLALFMKLLQLLLVLTQLLFIQLLPGTHSFDAKQHLKDIKKARNQRKHNNLL